MSRKKISLHKGQPDIRFGKRADLLSEQVHKALLKGDTGPFRQALLGRPEDDSPRGGKRRADLRGRERTAEEERDFYDRLHRRIAEEVVSGGGAHLDDEQLDAEVQDVLRRVVPAHTYRGKHNRHTSKEYHRYSGRFDREAPPTVSSLRPTDVLIIPAEEDAVPTEFREAISRGHSRIIRVPGLVNAAVLRRG